MSRHRPYSPAVYWRLLRENHDFRRMWFAQVVSEMGDWLYAVAIYSLLLELTGQARSVGVAVVLQLLPQVLVAPASGVLNDRLPRRVIMIASDICRVFVVLGMLFVHSASMVWLIWTLLLAGTVFWALFEPGRSAIVPNLARNRDEMMVANSLSSLTWAVNFAMGSGLGGLVAYHFGRNVLFILNALSFVISAYLLSRMKIVEHHTDGKPPFRFRELFDFRPVKAGYQYIARDPRMVSTILVKMGMGLLGAHWVILPLYGQRLFALPGPGGGALAMSLLLGCRGIGSLCGSFTAAAWARGDQVRMRAGIFSAFLLAAGSYLALAFAPSLPLACLAVIIGQAGTAATWVYSTTLLQSITEDGFRGRVFSADFSGLFLVMSLISLACSQFVDWGAGVRVVAFAIGLVGLAPAAAWLYCQRFWRAQARAAAA